MSAPRSVRGGALVILATLVALAFWAGAAGAGASCEGLAPTLVGTPGPDTLEGTDDDDVILGLAGDDVIRGNGGNDTICGGEGADGLAGGDGQDVLIGEAGGDSFAGGPGADTIRGGSDHDTVTYQEAPGGVRVNLDSGKVKGASGRDVIAGVESAIGSRFDDQLIGTNGRNVLEGSDGDDDLWGAAGNDELNGGLGNDELTGLLGRDLINGGEGVDVANYLADPASRVRSVKSRAIKLLAGEWSAAGASRELVMTGGQGRDRLIGIEELVGSPFDDDLVASSKSSGTWLLARIVGGPGDDTVGAKRAEGGTGDDTLQGKQIKGGAGDDILLGGGPGGTFDGGAGQDTLTFERIRRTDVLRVHVDLERRIWRFPGANPSVGGKLRGIENIVGSPNNDVLRGAKGSQGINGLGGDDELWGGPGNDILIGGRGRDTISYTKTRGGVSVNLAAGRTTGGHGTDALRQIENVIGSGRRDTIIGDNKRNVLRGGFQNDRLEGRGGNDLLIGQAGRDLAIGGLGKDRCSAEIRVSCERKTGTGDPDDDPEPADPAPLSWVIDKVDTSRNEGQTCSFDNCESFKNAGKMTEGTYVQTHTKLATYGDPSSGNIIDAQFNVQFTPPPAELAPGQRVTLETSGGANGFANFGGQRMVFFYRATTDVFAPEPDAKPTSTDSPETLLILEATHTGEIKGAGTSATFVTPSTSLYTQQNATFSISAIGLNFASITWIYKIKVNPSN